MLVDMLIKMIRAGKYIPESLKMSIKVTEYESTRKGELSVIKSLANKKY